MINQGYCFLPSVRALAITTCILTGTLYAHAEEPRKYSESELQSLYTSFLSAEGYQPTVDKDGDVQFKKEGRKYFIEVNEKDPECFRVVFAGFWQIENESERQQVLEAANHATAMTKAAKVYIVKDHVWASVEVFVPTPEDFKPVFSGTMSCIECGVGTFAEKMRG